MIIVVMGISGCGKSTLGKMLADRLEVPFEEGDAYHPEANVKKMSAGIPLDDADREPWLESLADHMRKWEAAGETRVLSCSALRKIYRDKFRAATKDLRFAFLDGAKDLVRDRMMERQNHYMPVTLIESQLAALEVPHGEEDVIWVNISRPPQDLVDELIEKITPLIAQD